MEVKFDELNEQDIVNLIAWFAKKKGQTILIHTEDGFDVEITLKTREDKKKDSEESNIDIETGLAMVACCCL